MDQKAFKKGEAVTSITLVKRKADLVIESPLDVRQGSPEYWWKKIEFTETMISNLQSTFLASDEVLPELFLIDYFKLSKAVHLTQAHGFMQEKRILGKSKRIKRMQIF